MIDYEEAESDDEAGEEELEEGEIAQISINVVSGSTDYTTMRVKGVHGKKNLYILIDSGSTHNFVDKKVANLLGWLHGSGQGGHSGRDVTLQRVKSLFYWKGMAKDTVVFAELLGLSTMQV